MTKPEDEAGLRVGKAGNAYGGVHIIHHEGRYYWAVEDWNGCTWEEIPKYLYNALSNFADKQEKAEKKFDFKPIEKDQSSKSGTNTGRFKPLVKEKAKEFKEMTPEKIVSNIYCQFCKDTGCQYCKEKIVLPRDHGDHLKPPLA